MSTFFVLIFLHGAFAQLTHRPRLGAGVDLSEEAAAERWREFSSARLGGEFCMGFEITHRPLRGEDTKFKGVMLGAEIGGALFTRIIISPLAEPQKTEEFILKSSPSGSEVWKLENGAFARLESADWHKPMIAGLLYSPFELLMPYRHWRAKYAGAGRAGQPTHNFELRDESSPGVVVNVALTRDFNAPARVRIFSGGALRRTASLGAVKKVDGLWIMREAYLRDELSRANDVLVFTHAKFGLSLPRGIFNPASAAKPEIPEMRRL